MFVINLIYYLCLLAVATIFVMSYFFKFMINPYLSTFLIQGVVMFAMPVVMYSAFVSKSVKKTFKDFGFKKITFTVLIYSILLGFVLFLVNNYVADIFYTILSVFGYDGSINVSLSVRPFSIELLLSCIAPGICEEILHRGMLMRGSIKQGYTKYGLMFSSLLFGLMHLNIQQCFYAMILGGLMGVVVIVADSIYPAMIIHFMNNALSTYFSSDYGIKYDWPLARFKYRLESMILSTNLILSIITISGIIFLLLLAYRKLVRAISKDNHKRTAIKLAKDLNLDNLNYADMQSKLNEIETILQHTEPNDEKLISDNATPLRLVDILGCDNYNL